MQARLDRNKKLSTRNAKGIYLLQGILYCGECNGKVNVQAIRYFYKTLADGTRKRYEPKSRRHQYRCGIAHKFGKEENHPKPYIWGGVNLDWQVWRHLVDFGIKHPEVIREQVQERA